MVQRRFGWRVTLLATGAIMGIGLGAGLHVLRASELSALASAPSGDAFAWLWGLALTLVLVAEP